ncbi:MAG: MBL fold metallo-hydrolase [Candidatus Riflebacteria bacterium]|nr:MBL fold metallo-hydrolase [Candidatus Riflebacteria bacterium]
MLPPIAEFRFGDLILVRYILGPMSVNTYLIFDKNKKEGILVDPAWKEDSLIDRINDEKISLPRVFLTHGHVDHIMALGYFKEKYNAKVFISKEDSKMLVEPSKNLSEFLGEPISFEPADEYIKDGEEYLVGSFKFKTSLIPGHTSGGMAFDFKAFVLTGDTLFAGGVGRSDFPGGDHAILIEKIWEKLMLLPSDEPVFPGHGPESTVGREKNSNPFFCFHKI